MTQSIGLGNGFRLRKQREVRTKFRNYLHEQWMLLERPSG